MNRQQRRAQERAREKVTPAKIARGLEVAREDRAAALQILRPILTRGEALFSARGYVGALRAGSVAAGFRTMAAATRDAETSKNYNELAAVAERHGFTWEDLDGTGNTGGGA